MGSIIGDVCQKKMDKVSQDKSEYIKKKVPANTTSASHQDK